MRRFGSLHSMVGLALIAAALAGCGGSGGGGGGGGKELGELLGYKFSEGTKTAPIVLGDIEQAEGGVVLRQKSTVGNGGTATPAEPSADSFYVVSGITPGVEYVITLADPTDDANLYVYPGDPSYGGTPLSHLSTAATETFIVQAGDNVTSFFISVDGSGTTKGAEYDLSVLVKPLSEGEIDDPVYVGDLIEEGSIARAGSAVAYTAECCGIQVTGDSYYSVYIGGADVLISLTNMTDDVDLFVYEDETFSSLACAPGQKPGTAVETCLYSGSADYLYIAVDGHNAINGAAFRLNVIQAPIGTGFCEAYLDWDYSETNLYLWPYGQDDICYMEAFPSIRHPGNSSNYTTVLPGGAPGIRAIDPFDPPAAGVVGFGDGSRDSYYWFNGLTPGHRYRLSLEDATDQAELYVFDRDASYSTPVCRPSDYTEGSKVQACIFEASSTVVYAAVDGYYTVRGAAFTLQLMPEFIQEGTTGVPPTPKDLGTAPILADLSEENIRTVLKDADIGIIGDKDSYYKVTVEPETQYYVSIPGMSDDVDLYVYGADSTYTTPVCVPYLGGTAAEQCVITTAADQTAIYFAVDGYFTKDGAAFLLSVAAGNGGGEGTDTVPGDAPLNLGTAPVTHFGFVIGTGMEEGQFDNEDPDLWNDLQDSFYRVTVNAESTYRVTLDNVGGDVDLFVFGESGFGAITPLCYSRNEGNDSPEQCVADTSGAITTLYIAVDGSWVTPGVFAEYRLRVQEQVPPTPTVMTVSVPLIEEEIEWASDYGIGGPNDRYYSVSLPSAGTYRIQIANLTDDLDLYVYGTDSSYQSSISCTNTYNSGTTSEYCNVTVGSATTVYFAVDGAWMQYAYSATYDISVAPAP